MIGPGSAHLEQFLATPASRRQTLKGLTAALSATLLGAAPRRTAAAAPQPSLDFTHIYGDLSLALAAQNRLQYFPMEMFLSPGALSLYLPSGFTEFPKGWRASVVGRWVAPGPDNTFLSDTVARFDVYANNSQAKQGYTAVEDALTAIGGETSKQTNFTYVQSPDGLRADALRHFGKVVAHLSETVAEGTDLILTELLPPAAELLRAPKVPDTLDRSLFVAPGAVAIDLALDSYGGQFFPPFGLDEQMTAFRQSLAANAASHWVSANSFPLADGTFLSIQQQEWDFLVLPEVAAQLVSETIPDILTAQDATTGTLRRFVDLADPLLPSPEDLAVDQLLLDLFLIANAGTYIPGVELFVQTGPIVSAFSIVALGLAIHPPTDSDSPTDALDQVKPLWTATEPLITHWLDSVTNHPENLQPYPVGSTLPPDQLADLWTSITLPPQ